MCGNTFGARMHVFVQSGTLLHYPGIANAIPDRKCNPGIANAIPESGISLVKIQARGYGATLAACTPWHKHSPEHPSESSEHVATCILHIFRLPTALMTLMVMISQPSTRSKVRVRHRPWVNPGSGLHHKTHGFDFYGLK